MEICETLGLSVGEALQLAVRPLMLTHLHEVNTDSSASDIWRYAVIPKYPEQNILELSLGNKKYWIILYKCVSKSTQHMRKVWHHVIITRCKEVATSPLLPLLSASGEMMSYTVSSVQEHIVLFGTLRHLLPSKLSFLIGRGPAVAGRFKLIGLENEISPHGSSEQL